MSLFDRLSDNLAKEASETEERLKVAEENARLAKAALKTKKERALKFLEELRVVEWAEKVASALQIKVNTYFNYLTGRGGEQSFTFYVRDRETFVIRFLIHEATWSLEITIEYDGVVERESYRSHRKYEHLNEEDFKDESVMEAVLMKAYYRPIVNKANSTSSENTFSDGIYSSGDSCSSTCDHGVNY